MFSGNTETAGPGNILWKPLAQSNSSQLQYLTITLGAKKANKTPTESSPYPQRFYSESQG